MPKKITSNKNKEKNREKQHANLIKFKPGQSGNPKGHPKGQRNFSTIYNEAIREIAKQKKVSVDQLENAILKVGIAKAMGGDYRFYQDLMDRLNGKPVQRNELTGANGRDLIPDAAGKKAGDDLIDEFINGSKK